MPLSLHSADSPKAYQSTFLDYPIRIGQTDYRPWLVNISRIALARTDLNAGEVTGKFFITEINVVAE